jgi:hypothetical protein
MFRRLGPVVFLLLPALAGGAPAPDPARDPRLLENARARAAAAQKVYEVTLRRLKTGAPGPGDPLDRLYWFSRRWMEAQRELAGKPEDRIAAVRDHLQRIQALEKIVQAMFKAGRVLADDAAAVEFYRLEAEGWLRKQR